MVRAVYGWTPALDAALGPDGPRAASRAGIQPYRADHWVVSYIYHQLIDHTRSVDLWPSGTKCTRDLPVSHVVWHNTSMGGIMPYHMAGKSKRERSVKGSFPPAVSRNQIEWRWAWQAQTTRVTVRGRAWIKFWSKNAFHKKRRGPPTRSGRWERSFTERDLQTPHCLPFD